MELAYRIGVIGDLETVIGFGLAGVADLHVRGSREENLAAMRRMVESGGVGIIFVTAGVAEELEPEIERLRERPLPIIVTIPDSGGTAPKVDELGRIIRRTLGAKIVVGEE